MWTSTQRSSATGAAQLEETAELERLRQRAYGPDADIAGDATAQARLSELEAAQNRQPTPIVDAAALGPAPVPDHAPAADDRPVAEGVPGAEAVEGSVTEQDPVERPVASAHPVGGAPAAPWWRRRRWLGILGVAIAALALIATLETWMSPRAPDYLLALESVGADEPIDRYGTLELLGLSTDELRRYEDFRGLHVWSGESRYGMTCLLVAHPVQGLAEPGGINAEGCSPEGLDTLADLQLCSGCSAPEVWGGLPTGSLIRFVLKGDHVDVYVRAANPIASQG